MNNIVIAGPRNTKSVITDPPTPDALKNAHPTMWAHWNCEAVDASGQQLWTRVTYNHATRGAWEAVLFNPVDSSLTRLKCVPNIRAKRWVNLTRMGECIVQCGRE